MEDVITELPSPSAQGDQSKLDCYYPPKLTYAVEAQTFPPTEQLDCTIQIGGAVEANRGKPLFFNLQSKTAPFHRNGELYSAMPLILLESFLSLCYAM